MEPIRLAGGVEVVEPGRDADAGYRQLAAAVILQALLDAQVKKDVALRFDALLSAGLLGADDSYLSELFRRPVVVVDQSDQACNETLPGRYQ